MAYSSSVFRFSTNAISKTSTNQVLHEFAVHCDQASPEDSNMCKKISFAMLVKLWIYVLEPSINLAVS